MVTVEGTDYASVNGFTLTIDAGLTTGTDIHAGPGR